MLFDIKKRVAGGSYSRTKFSTKFSTELSTPSEHRILEFRICQLNRMCVCVHTHSFNLISVLSLVLNLVPVEM